MQALARRRSNTKIMEKIKFGPSTHLYPKPAVLVGALVNEKPNFMTASWCGIACQKPPAISVAIRKVRFTLKGINQNGTFSINIPCTKLVRKVDYCGIYSGKDKDKSQIFKYFYGTLKTAPLIDECPINFECKVIHSLDLGSHILVIGEIIETYIDKNRLSNEKPDAEKIDPLIYASGAMQYHQMGEAIGKAYHIGKELK